MLRVVWCLLISCGWCMDDLALVSVSIVGCVWFDSGFSLLFRWLVG